MSAAEMREAAAKTVGAAALEHMFDRRDIKHMFGAIRDEDPEVWAEIVAATGRAAIRGLPDDEGMVEMVARAIASVYGLDDFAPFYEDARAAIRAINGEKP